MAVEATRAIGDANLGAENEGCALVEHPYLAHQLSVFNLQAHRGIPIGGVSPRSETRRCKEHEALDRFRPHYA
jgi:hypothetical protein